MKFLSIHWAFLLLFMLCLSDHLYAQIMPEQVYSYGKRLYIDYEKGDSSIRLTDDQIRGLAPYGFDYERYFQLKRRHNIDTVIEIIGAALAPISGYLEQNKHEPAGLLLCIPSVAFVLWAWNDKSNIEDEIESLVKVMNDSPHWSFSPSGIGVVYHF